MDPALSVLVADFRLAPEVDGLSAPVADYRLAPEAGFPLAPEVDGLSAQTTVGLMYPAVAGGD